MAWREERQEKIQNIIKAVEDNSGELLSSSKLAELCKLDEQVVKATIEYMKNSNELKRQNIYYQTDNTRVYLSIPKMTEIDPNLDTGQSAESYITMLAENPPLKDTYEWIRKNAPHIKNAKTASEISRNLDYKYNRLHVSILPRLKNIGCVKETTVKTEDSDKPSFAYYLNEYFNPYEQS